MFRARSNSNHNSSSHTALSMREYIIQRDTPLWISPFRIRLAVGRLTRLRSFRREIRPGLRLPLQLHLQQHLRPKLKLHRQVRLHRKLRLHLQVHLKLRLQPQLPLELEAKGTQACASQPPSPRASEAGLRRGEQGSGYSNKRSSESRQICDHVSMVSRRANNSSLARNVRPVIIASRFSTFGSASLNT